MGRSRCVLWIVGGVESNNVHSHQFEGNIMMEFKIQVDENLVGVLGYKEIENLLQEFVQTVVISSAAYDVLQDLQTIDLENDAEWQVARDLAWQQEKHKYLVHQ
jgi:hypothetical protein